MKSKKQLILLILNELNINTDKNHPITQTQIAKNLSGEWFTCDRKTVCRNIKFLQEMGYPIKRTAGGFYFEKEFSVEQVAFIRKAILSANEGAAEERQALADRVVTALTKCYRR